MHCMPHKTLDIDYKEVLVLCSEIIAVYCGVENPVPCGGTFIVATAQLTFLPFLFLVILCVSGVPRNFFQGGFNKFS